MKPHLEYAVENKLSENPDAPQLKVALDFQRLEDFEPEAVAKQVGPLNKLLELRTKLADLRGSLQTNEALDELLQDAITSTEKMERLRSEVQPKEETKEGETDG